MSEPLVSDEVWWIKFDKNVSFEELINTPEDSDNGFFDGVDSKYPDILKEKTKFFPFCPGDEVSPLDKSSKYMNEMKPNDYTQSEKLIYDRTDKKLFYLS